MPAAAVIPAQQAYTNVVAVKTLVVGKENKKMEKVYFLKKINFLNFFKKIIKN